MTKRKLSPQENKLSSYLKDRRNMVAESRSHSRFAIAKRRAYGHQALRHEQKIVLNRILQAADEEIETLQARAASVRGQRWRKVPDGSLAEFVSVLAMERLRRGMTGGIRTSRILKKQKIYLRESGKKGSGILDEKEDN